MAPVVLSCEVPEWVAEVEPGVAVEMLKVHHQQVYGTTTKPEKPKRPELTMAGDAVEATDFDRFAFLFNQYKKLSGITSEAPSHLLECLGTEVMAILYNTYGAAITDQTEGQLITNIRRLVVKQRNTMATVMQVLRMYQDSDQAVLNFIAQLKAAARLCQFTAQCECSKAVEFTDMIVLYKLVAGIVDEELQKELLTKADRTLAEAEKMAVAAESAKYSQEAMTNDTNSANKSTSPLVTSPSVLLSSLFLLCSVTKADWLSKIKIQDNVLYRIQFLSFGWMKENRSSPHHLDVMVNCLLWPGMANS